MNSTSPNPPLQLEELTAVLLAQGSTAGQLIAALERYVQVCHIVGGIEPDPAFDAWAGDSFLADGVAIAPQAAAHCARDYRRTVVFIRGVSAALEQSKQRFPGETLHIVYAGCGPYATLLLPLLARYAPTELDVCLLDIHQDSLDSVKKLLGHFGLERHSVETVQGDACTYVHSRPPHLIITETMQKSLEQEPQLAITAQLAPQLRDGGIFIPGKIEVRMCLACLDRPRFGDTGSSVGAVSRRSTDQHELCKVLTLTPELAAPLLQSATFRNNRAKWELQPVIVEIPSLESLGSLRAALFTCIQVFGQHRLEDYDAEITLPLRCTDMSPLVAGERWEISYQLGGYPRFDIRRATECG